METGKSRISKIAYGCFYLAVIIEVLLVLIDKSAYINPIEGRIFQLTFLLCLIKVSLTKYTIKEYAVMLLFGIIGAISYFATGRNEMIRIVMFLAACRDVNMKQCLKAVFYMTLLGCVTIVLLSITGIYGAVSLTRDYGRGSLETRYTLGMGHPNALHCMVWALITLALYLYGTKMKWFHYALLFVMNLLFFQLTGSRTSALAALFTLAMAYLTSRKKSPVICKLSAYIGILITIFSIGISVLIAGNAYHVYNYAWNIDRSQIPSFWMRLDSLLTGRIRILTETDGFEGTIQTWSFFSRPENDRFFDMGWIRLFYWYGIVPASLCVIVLLLLMVYCCKKKNYMAVMLIASFALYSVMEAHAVSDYLARNYVLFVIGEYWYQMIAKEPGNRYYFFEPFMRKFT